MVKSWIKIINKSPYKAQLIATIEQIVTGNWERLDIVAIQGKGGYYRCRVGKLRIIFFEKEGNYYIDQVGYRGDIYRS